MRLAQSFLIGVFLLLIALPALQMRLRFVAEVELSGILVESVKPSRTLSAWWQGEFQSQAEAWFDDRIGFRGHAVRTDNQIGLSLFHEASARSADPVVLGRRMMVYQTSYVTAYDGIDEFGDKALRKRARGLRRLQDALARRGTAFLFLIAPSKAAIYPEYLPSGFVRPDGQRPATAYERMLPMLRNEGVHVVDGHVLLQEEKARSPHALFPPGGVHWNRYSASIVLRQVWKALGEQLGRPLALLRCRAVLEDDTPARADQETDGSDILNAWHVSHADWKFPRPDLYTEDAGDAFRPRLVVVGDSFWWVPAAIIAEQQMASRGEFFYYYNRRERRPGPSEPLVDRPGGLVRGMSWEYVLSADAIIVQTNEAALGDAGWGFVEEAQGQLAAGPPFNPGRAARPPRKTCAGARGCLNSGPI